MADKTRSLEKRDNTHGTHAPGDRSVHQGVPSALQDVSGPVGLLQATGNLAVQRLFRAGPSQPDAPEGPSRSVIQRKAEPCACGGTCASCAGEEQNLVQRASDASSNPSPQASSRHPLSGLGDGRRLDAETRLFFEARFSQDFSRVRVHSGGQAGESARAIHACAFTAGQDVVFGVGEYAPETREGKRLLAHELTHVVQQGRGRIAAPARKSRAGYTVTDPHSPEEAEADRTAERVLSDMPTAHTAFVPAASPPPSASPTLARQTTPGTIGQPQAPPDPQTVGKAVDVIIDALEGYTSRWDSATILQQFQGKGGATVQAIITELKGRAGAHGLTGEGMVDWLLGDMTEEDRRELRLILIRSRVEDMTRLVVQEIKDLLEGPTSESDSTAIYQALTPLGGLNLDALLTQLESQMGQDQHAMAAWLFGDLDRANAERVRQHCFQSGGPRAIRYAADWTASKIEALLSGYTGHSDSTDIVWNFRTTPLDEHRALVQMRLNELTQANWTQSAEEALMEDMDQADYEELRTMGGLTLRPYARQRGTLEAIVSGAEWGLIVAEWLACGIAGIVTGLLSVVWDFVKIVKDVVVAVWDLLWSLVYLISGGAAGSSNWLAVKQFFIGIGQFFTDPGAVFEQLWKDLTLEFHTIEGPFSDCRRAEFIVRKFVNALVNIILIFAAGYGAVKAGASALSGAAEFASLAGRVGVGRALVQTGGRTARAAGRFAAVSAEESANLLRVLRQPGQVLARISARLNVVLLAVEDQGFWGYVRGRAGVLAENERRFWEDQRAFWRERATAQQQRHADLTDEIDSLNAKLQENQAPEQGNDAVRGVSDDVQQLDREADQLHRDVTGSAEPSPGPEGVGTREGLTPLGPAEEASLSPGTRNARDVIRLTVCGACFPAGTRIITLTGCKNIEDLVPGDLVLAGDERLTGRKAYRRVVQTFQNFTTSLLALTIDGQTIRSTPDHVWWALRKGWLLARDLEVGDTVLTSDGGYARISAVRGIDAFALTYNCEVGEYHTYFVSAGDGKCGFWVHNNSVGIRVLRADQIYQLVLPTIVVSDPQAIRQVIGNSLVATGNYSTELSGLYAFIRRGGGAGFQGITADAVNNLQVVLRNLETKGGGVVAAIDLERIGAKRIFDLSNPQTLQQLLSEPNFSGIQKAMQRLASEGVVAVRGNVPALAVRSLVNIPEGLSEAEQRALLLELLRPCR